MTFRFARILPIVVMAGLVLSFVAIPPKPVQALGMSPPTIRVEGLLRGTTQKRMVSLYRGPRDIGNVYLHVEPGYELGTGEFIVSGTDDVVMLEGQDRLDYEFEVGSGDAANGDYEVRLRFLKQADPQTFASGSGVTVITGVTTQILVSVGGEEKLDYKLLSISAGTTEVGRNIDVEYSISNNGNVDWRIQKMKFDFKDAFTGAVVVSQEVAGSELGVVKAGQVGQKFNLSLPVNLPEGEYKVAATFYYQEQEVGVLESTSTFIVSPVGTLAQSGVLSGLSVNKQVFKLGEKIKLDAVFQNDGEIEYDAVFVSQLYKDGEVTDLIRSNEYSVSKGEEMVFTQLVDVGDVGSYEIEGYVEYGKKRTSPVKVSFEVKENALVGSVENKVVDAVSVIGGAANSYLGLLILALVIILGTIGFIFIKRHRRKSNEQDVQPLMQVQETESVVSMDPLLFPIEQSQPVQQPSSEQMPQVAQQPQQVAQQSQVLQQQTPPQQMSQPIVQPTVVSQQQQVQNTQISAAGSVPRQDDGGTK